MTQQAEDRAAYLAGLRALILQIPEGRVLSYSDAAKAVGFGTGRHSAAALSRGLLGEIPWWRVVRADGTLPPDLVSSAAARWEAEGTPTRPAPPSLTGSVRVAMGSARWIPTAQALRETDSAMERASGGCVR